MISPQAAPMRCARRDVVAAWNENEVSDISKSVAQPTNQPTHPSKMDAPYSQKREEKAIHYQLLTINY
jgi:hypothetical protein